MERRVNNQVATIAAREKEFEMIFLRGQEGMSRDDESFEDCAEI